MQVAHQDKLQLLSIVPEVRLKLRCQQNEDQKQVDNQLHVNQLSLMDLLHRHAHVVVLQHLHLADPQQLLQRFKLKELKL